MGWRGEGGREKVWERQEERNISVTVVATVLLIEILILMILKYNNNKNKDDNDDDSKTQSAGQQQSQPPSKLNEAIIWLLFDFFYSFSFDFPLQFFRDTWLTADNVMKWCRHKSLHESANGLNSPVPDYQWLEAEVLKPSSIYVIVRSTIYRIPHGLCPTLVYVVYKLWPLQDEFKAETQQGHESWKVKCIQFSTVWLSAL